MAQVRFTQVAVMDEGAPGATKRRWEACRLEVWPEMMQFRQSDGQMECTAIKLNHLIHMRSVQVPEPPHPPPPRFSGRREDLPTAEAPTEHAHRHARMHTHAHTDTHTHARARAHTHTQTHTHTHARTHMHRVAIEIA